MKWIEIYKELRRQRTLANKRSINFQQNRSAKIATYILSSFMVIYLLAIAIMLSLIANSVDNITAVEFIFTFSPFILIIDFLFRFWLQQTPTQLIKPYVLLPLPRYACINSFILSSIFTWGNAVWFIIFIPYSIMSVVFGYGIITTLLFLSTFLILIFANSQWYSIVRTLVNDSVLYWFLPIGVYALAILPALFGGGEWYDNLIDAFILIGSAIDVHNPLPLFLAIALLLLLAYINQRVQYSHVMSELSKTEKTPLHNASKFSFLERYGEKGLYLQLEIKTILRNKNPRKSFISATCLVVMMSLAITFSDVYDTNFMTNFWCLYNFAIFGTIMLQRIMGYEGNYIDGLMVRKENLLSMFNAKFDFYCIVLVFPFILMLPTVVSGKWDILMVLSYGIFTAGVQYFALFQSAVYNRQTIPLNTKFTGNSGQQQNYVQLIFGFGSFILPIGIISIAQTVLSHTASYIFMMALGLIFIAFRPLWMSNIYNRFMLRRYSNMEGLRQTR